MKAVYKNLLGLFVILMCALCGKTHAQTAEVRIIHNSGDAVVRYVDVWLDSNRLLDNFEFRTSTGFLSIPAEDTVVIGISDSSAQDTSSLLFTTELSLSPGKEYFFVLNGILSSAGYQPNIPFSIDTFNMARSSSNLPGMIDLLFHHGVTDLGAVDLTQSSPSSETTFNNRTYGSFDSYASLDFDNYRFILSDSNKTNAYGEFDAPFANQAYDDLALNIIASGFRNPASNSNGPEMGLFLVLPEGGEFIPMDQLFGQIQFLHNASDSSLDSIDVYVNDSLRIDDLRFRSGSDYISLPSGIAHQIAITRGGAPNSSIAQAEDTVVLSSDQPIQAIIDGHSSQGQFTPKRELQLSINNSRIEANIGYQCDVCIHHGASEFESIFIEEASNSSSALEFTVDYATSTDYTEMALTTYSVRVFEPQEDSLIGRYLLPLRALNLEGEAITLLSNGYIDTSSNENTPFGLWLARPFAAPFIPLSATTGLSELSTESIQVFPNPASDHLTIRSEERIDRVSMHSINGQRVFEASPGNDQYSLILSDFPSGVFILEVETESETVLKKLIIQ